MFKRVVPIVLGDSARSVTRQEMKALFKTHDAVGLEAALAHCVDSDIAMELRLLIVRERWKRSEFTHIVTHFEAVGDRIFEYPRFLKIALAALMKLGRFADIADVYHENQAFFTLSIEPTSNAHQYCDDWLAMAASVSNRLITDMRRTRRDAAFLKSFLSKADNESAEKPIIKSAALRARRVCAEIAAEPTWSGEHPRHIALAGTSYCGSTVLGAVLGSLPGCGNVGESYWLTRRRRAGQPKIADTEAFQGGDVLHCMSCGSACDKLTPAFRLALAEDSTQWYRKIAQQFDVGTLFSSDKNHPKYLDNDPLLRMDTVVLFKSPEQHLWSNVRKARGQVENFNPLQSFAEFERSWVTEYRIYLETLVPTGKIVFLNFDAFCMAPERHLRRLCDLLDLPYLESVLTKVRRDQHFLGGNALVGAAYQQRSTLQIKPLGETGLSAKDRSQLVESAAVQEIWIRCMDQYHSQFD